MVTMSVEIKTNIGKRTLYMHSVILFVFYKMSKAFNKQNYVITQYSIFNIAHLNMAHDKIIEQEMSLKKTNGVRLKKEENITQC